MNLKNKTIILIIAALPFYLNDISNIFVKKELLWISIDYCLKIVPLTFLFYLLKKEILSRNDLGLISISPLKLVNWTIGVTIIGLSLDEPGFALWAKILPSFRLGSIPIGPDSQFYNLDMTVGLMLVAVAEEIIFRALAFSALKERGCSTQKIFIISGLVFGLIHWSQGPVAVAATAVTGSALMICMWRTGSIYPTIIAHYLINYLSFSGKAYIFWGL